MSMPILHGHECAVCGALKRQTNHWWLVWIAEIISSEGHRSELEITAWTPELCKSERRSAACGSNCTQKLVERWLMYGRLEPHSTAFAGAQTLNQQPGAEIRATTKKE
jgi:hypothetical protein